jgi:hypothetical protein
VWIDFQAEKSVALPDRIRSQLPAAEV